MATLQGVTSRVRESAAEVALNPAASRTLTVTCQTPTSESSRGRQVSVELVLTKPPQSGGSPDHRYCEYGVVPPVTWATSEKFEPSTAVVEFIRRETVGSGFTVTSRKSLVAPGSPFEGTATVVT